MIADPVGGLWKFDREFQPLIGFLFTQAKADRLRLAGLDGQLGGVGETYTNERMIPELLEGVEAKEAHDCIAAFANHMTWNYSSSHPYGPAEHDRLLACGATMRQAVDARPDIDPRVTDERRAMIDNIKWVIGPDLSSRAEQFAAREQWMWRNFDAFAATLPARSKIIVWGATVHLAKNTAGLPPNDGDRPLGAIIRARYGDEAYTLGFAAGSGTYRVFRRRIWIDPPPTSSLEARALTDNGASAVFLDPARLRGLGFVPGGVLEHDYRTADWADVVDGAVVFREEWPTHSKRPGYGDDTTLGG